MSVEQIDIEALLYRAYAVKRIDKAVGQSGRQSLWQMLGLAYPVLATPSYAECVDTSSAGALVAARARRAVTVAADPLLVLHDRVLALGDMWFAWAGDEIELWDRETAAQAGCEIAGANGSWWLERCGAPVARLSQAGVMALVIQHARAGSRPEVHEGWRPGRARKARAGRMQSGALRADEVQLDRASYHAWRCALVLLQAECEGLLNSYRVTGPLAPVAPWLDVSDATPENRLPADVAQ